MFAKANIVALGIVTLGIAAMFGFLVLERSYVRRNSRQHMIARAQNQVEQIASAIHIVSEIEHHKLATNQYASITISGKQRYSRLAESPSAMLMAAPSEKCNELKTFCDLWGQDISVRLEPGERVVHVVLWSWGPNRQDNSCGEDDIVERFSVSVP